jgi:hypothetical protein
VEGRFADPLVGREVLVGLIAGAGTVLVQHATALAGSRTNVAAAFMWYPLAPAPCFWAAFLGAVASSVLNTLGAFASLLLLRLVLRRDALVWVGLLVAGTMLGLRGTPSAIDVAGAVIDTVFFLIALRTGVLAAVAVGTVSTWLTGLTPLTMQFNRWYAWQTVVLVVVLVAAALASFRVVMGRRRIIPAEVFDA